MSQIHAPLHIMLRLRMQIILEITAYPIRHLAHHIITGDILPAPSDRVNAAHERTRQERGHLPHVDHDMIRVIPHAHIV